MPPKRKKARVNEKPWGNLPTPCVPGQDFTIHDDELAGALAKLSPQVERHRKGRGPKRERCKGYFDEDVVDLKGRKLLGESAQSSELTKVQPFLGEAADAAFGFRA